MWVQSDTWAYVSESCQCQEPNQGPSNLHASALTTRLRIQYPFILLHIRCGPMWVQSDTWAYVSESCQCQEPNQGPSDLHANALTTRLKSLSPTPGCSPVPGWPFLRSAASQWSVKSPQEPTKSRRGMSERRNSRWTKGFLKMGNLHNYTLSRCNACLSREKIK